MHFDNRCLSNMKISMKYPFVSIIFVAIIFPIDLKWWHHIKCTVFWERYMKYNIKTSIYLKVQWIFQILYKFRSLKAIFNALNATLDILPYIFPFTKQPSLLYYNTLRYEPNPPPHAAPDWLFPIFSQPPHCGCALLSNETPKMGRENNAGGISGFCHPADPWIILLFYVCVGGIQKLCTVIHIRPAWGLQPIICTATARTAFFLTNVGVGGGW